MSSNEEAIVSQVKIPIKECRSPSPKKTYMEALSENYNKLKGSFLSGNFGGGSSISNYNKGLQSPN